MKRLVWTAALLWTAAVGQTDKGHGHLCVSEYLERIAYLLGCCGDLPSRYPGPPMPNFLSDVQKASQALKEISLAERHSCPRVREHDRVNLRLSRVGALAFQARVKYSAEDVTERSDGRSEAELATRELLALLKASPSVSKKAHLWAAQTFVAVGRPLEALSLLQNEAITCCDVEIDSRRAAVLRGDIAFNLGLWALAAKSYSKWLTGIEEHFLCGHRSAILRAEELRRRGFRIAPVPPASGLVTCSDSDPVDWRPYFLIPE